MTENKRLTTEINGKICYMECSLDDVLRKLAKYESIGTIDELKALKEKSVAKKPLNDGMRIPFSYYCPNCKEELSDDGYEPDEEYCCNCGQHILIKN